LLRRLRVALDHRQPLDDDAVLLGKDAQHLAARALLLAGDDGDGVALANSFHQSTSGASEMIFMNFFARSSRATGPKMRVPIGSRSLLISTAELPSNLMKLPSGRPSSRRVRTITAL